MARRPGATSAIAPSRARNGARTADLEPMSATARRLPHVSARQLRALRLLVRVLQAGSTELAARVAFRLFLTPLRRRLDASDAPAVARAKLHRVDCGNGDL